MPGLRLRPELLRDALRELLKKTKKAGANAAPALTFAAAYDISVTVNKDTENSCDGDSKPGVNDQASGGGCEPRTSSTPPKITPELRAELAVGAAGIPPLRGACMMVHSKKVVQRKRKAFALFAGAKAFSVVFVWAF